MSGHLHGAFLTLAGLCFIGIADAVIGAATDPGARLPAPEIDAIETFEPLGLVRAIQIALEHNHAIRAGVERVRAGEARVREARAARRPQLDATVESRSIDDDRAEANFGRDPEQRVVASAAVRQIVFSDEVSARAEVERLLQRARVLEQEELVLDTVLATASAYLNLLRSEALLEIERENLRLSESNYERAQARLELGVANRAELYRWQTERANAQTRVVIADATLRRERIELNRTMNQRLDAAYRAITPGLTEPFFLVSSDRVREALASAAARARLREFFMDEALRGSPELARLRHEIDAQSRRLTAAQRRVYLPEISGHAGVQQELGRGGAGEETIEFATPSGQRFGIDTDDTEWEIGVEARLPLYQGGARFAERDRARAELDALRYRYDEALMRIRAEVLKQSYSAEASFEAIGYARTAAEAADRTLELVLEAYERGAVPVIDVTDAQATALISEENATNALYDFLIEYLQLQRLTGTFDLVQSDEAREERRQRLEDALR